MADLAAKSWRAALKTLSRDQLAEITREHGLEVADRRSPGSHVAAILAARSSVDPGEVLRTLSRDALKAICVALGLDVSGKEKEPIVQRILGGEVAVPVAHGGLPPRREAQEQPARRTHRPRETAAAAHEEVRLRPAPRPAAPVVGEGGARL